MGKYFGTDGFRGEVNRTLTSAHAWQIGRFLGHYFGKERKARIVIGKDPRRSSYTLEYALVAGLTASGADAYLLHVIPTPAVSYITRTDRFDCGIMISASHNSYLDNGIKLFDRNGEKMDEETIAAIEGFLDSGEELPFATGEEIGVAVDHTAGRNRYLGYLISLSTVSYRGKRVGLDCANGACFAIAKSVFDALGAEAYVINSTPNGVNINKEAGSTHIEVLQGFVKRNALDVGFAFDGDADRCIAVDENGNVVNGDGILYVMAGYMKERGLLRHNTVVTTVMSNFGLYKALERLGIRYEKTAVGDKYVYECMQKNGYRLGGEQSGHVIFSKLATTGDGLITAIKLMELICNSGKTLAELTEGYTVYPQVLENVQVKDREAALQDAAVLAAVAQAEEELGETGRILIRASGTEPVLRVMAEAESIEICRKCVFDVIAVMKKRGHL
ncbi:MAG: phosphoglucosamine mutase [Ruminococcaceae bacterium]|nr:phosphoglucosamine mutase [Oscillospiraceae bacterium]